MGLNGRPHDLGNISAYLGKPTGLEDYIGWLGNNFDPSISWKDLEWIRDFWDGPMVIKGILDPEDARDAVRFGADGIVAVSYTHLDVYKRQMVMITPMLVLHLTPLTPHLATHSAMPSFGIARLAHLVPNTVLPPA